MLARWARLTPAQRRLLMACGGGAGLAAVYNVPLGGALFSAEIMLGAISVPVVLPGPVTGLIASGYIRLIGWVSYHQARGRAQFIAPVLAFGLLGLAAFAYPQLLGNGKDMAHDAFTGSAGLGLLLALFALKPLMTASCLGCGASGGLFTPTLSTGAALGGATGLAWSLAWPGSPAGAYALVGAAAMLGAAMQAPLTGLVLILELTHGGFALIVPLIAATSTATVVARYVRRLLHLQRPAARPARRGHGAGTRPYPARRLSGLHLVSSGGAAGTNSPCRPA